MRAATELTREQIDRLADTQGGFYVAAASDDILFRSKEVVDDAVPGANAVAALNLIALTESSGDSEWLELAERTLKVFGGFAERHPAAFRTLAVAVKRFHEASGEIVDSIDPAPKEEKRLAVDSVRDRVVKADLTLSPSDDGVRRDFRLHVDVAPGWYLYSPESRSKEVRPVEVGAVDLVLSGVTFPKGEPLEKGIDRGEVFVYRNCFEILGEIAAVDDKRGCLRLEYQACEPGRCLAPAQIELPIYD
ncbi:MAG: protein-disulfide reductase DsbD family protein [Acidobacteriota bacterium]